jgi:hypothetical protein
VPHDRGLTARSPSAHQRRRARMAATVVAWSPPARHAVVAWSPGTTPRPERSGAWSATGRSHLAGGDWSGTATADAPGAVQR